MRFHPLYSLKHLMQHLLLWLIVKSPSRRLAEVAHLLDLTYKAGGCTALRQRRCWCFRPLNLNPATPTSLVMPQPCKSYHADLPLLLDYSAHLQSACGCALQPSIPLTQTVVQRSERGFIPTLSRLASAADRAVRRCERIDNLSSSGGMVPWVLRPAASMLFHP